MKKSKPGGLPPRTVKALGLTLPQWALQRDEVIK